VAVKGRRSLLAAALGVVAVGALATGGPLAFGSAVGSGSAGAHFNPGSVTFVSLDTGWALGTARCAGGACLALRETTDAGRSWSARPLPTSLVAAADRRVGGVLAELYGSSGLNVRFADLRDGWIYGGLAVPARRVGVAYVAIEPTLWSTHDGGVIWRRQPLPGFGPQGSIFDVEAAAATVYLMATNTTPRVIVESSPVAEDRWHVSSAVRMGLPAGGAQASGAIVLQGSSGWLVEGNDRGTTGSARLDSNGQWVEWAPPCASVGHSYAVPAPSTPRNLVAVCVMGGFAYPLSPAAPGGATIGSSWLYFSNDGGNTFEAGPELGPRGDFFGGVLASPIPGVILIGHGAGNGQDLVASFDGGIRWTVVYRGQLVFLGFTSPTQGVGIVRSSNSTTTMIMTFDGGHHWAAVTF